MSHIKGVYTIVERQNEEHPERKNLWIQIGIAFVNRDDSLNVRLNAFPVNGALHIRDLKSAEETEPGETASF